MFVDGALPRERVQAEIAVAGKVLRGQLVEVLSPSTDRRLPACPLSNQCGGCDWLHLAESAQRAAKLEIVLSALEHLGGIDRRELEVLATQISETQMGYRRRAVMHFQDGKLCLHGRRSHRSVPVPTCPALVPQLSELPGRLSLLLAKIERDIKAVQLLAGGGRASFAVLLTGAVRPAHLEVSERAVRQLGLAGAVLVPQDGSPQVVQDPTLLEVGETDQPTLFLRPDAFAQAHPEANAALRAAVVERLAPRFGERVLELYCGNGNLTFSIASRGAEVCGVESSGASLELARRSTTGTAWQVRFIQGDAKRVCEAMISERLRFDALVADPPRRGSPGIGAWARKLGCSRVIYVSCDPAALARDANELRGSDFRPLSLQLIDMFPQTRHPEAVMSFARR